MATGDPKAIDPDPKAIDPDPTAIDADPTAIDAALAGDHLAAWGIDPGYWDLSGVWRAVPRETLVSVLAAMGATDPGLAPPPAPVVVVGEHGPWPELPAGTLRLEGGATIDLGPPGDERPEKLPCGYHFLSPTAKLPREPGAPGPARECDGRLLVAVCPPSCPAPPGGSSWGWSVQLYAVRSANSWGIGDFADLGTLAEWAGRHGASFLLLNPMHAPALWPEPETSPYFPSSRCFLNPLYISVPEVPGAGELAQVGALGEEAKELNRERLIDRTRAWACKSLALEALFERFEASGGDPGFEEYQSERGRILDGYTSFCVLAERYGLPWQQWPENYRDPGAPAVNQLASSPEGRSRKRYHAWLQWTCERQLRAASERGAGSGAGLVLDLAVGVDGGGADAWLWQGTFALEMRAGAPPDDFNANGQDWGLSPWDPWKLRAASYEPYLQTLRAAFRVARGLRVDHVMGLFRLFWVALGSQPKDGTYVRSMWHETLGLLRLEASKAGGFVVGEDLGTVEPYVREALASSGVLSYKLFWFEDSRPNDWPQQALGAVTTHDLPTIAGVWTGADADAQRRMGLPLDEGRVGALRRRLAEWTSSPDDRPVNEVIVATYAHLSEAPCALLTAALDDAAAVTERPNMPGTVGQWPNWCLALPFSLEDLESSELATAIARQLASKRDGHGWWAS